LKVAHSSSASKPTSKAGTRNQNAWRGDASDAPFREAARRASR
jgi:hypothetical protein